MHYTGKNALRIKVKIPPSTKPSIHLITINSRSKRLISDFVVNYKSIASEKAVSNASAPALACASGTPPALSFSTYFKVSNIIVDITRSIKLSMMISLT